MVNASWKIKPWLEVGTNNQIEHYKTQSVAEGNEYGSMMLSVLQLDPLTKPLYPIDDLPLNMATIYKDHKNMLAMETATFMVYQLSLAMPKLSILLPCVTTLIPRTEALISMVLLI